MAIKLLRARQGRVSVEPAPDYSGVVSRYSSAFQAALREEENGLVRDKFNALEQGSLSYSAFRSFMQELINKYPSGTSRRVDLEETLRKGEITNARIKLRDKQISLTKKYGEVDGLTLDEQLKMNTELLDLARQLQVDKIDPETYSSLLSQRMGILSDIQAAREKAQKAQKSEMEALIRGKLGFVDTLYSSGQITGADMVAAKLDFYQDLENLGALGSTDISTRLELQQEQVARGQGMIFDVKVPDTSAGAKLGAMKIAPASLDAIQNRYIIAQSGVNEFRVKDTFTNTWALEDRFGSKEEASKAAIQKTKETPYTMMTPRGEETYVYDPETKLFGMVSAYKVKSRIGKGAVLPVEEERALNLYTANPMTTAPKTAKGLGIELPAGIAPMPTAKTVGEAFVQKGTPTITEAEVKAEIARSQALSKAEAAKVAQATLPGQKELPTPTPQMKEQAKKEEWAISPTGQLMAGGKEVLPPTSPLQATLSWLKGLFKF